LQLFEAATQAMPIELSNDALGVQLTIIKRAKEQLELLESGYEEQVKESIKKGKNIRGWLNEQTYGRLKWIKPISEIILLGEMLQIDLKKPDDVITPTQAKDKGVDNSMVNAFSSKPNTGMKIVPENLDKIMQVFQK